MNTTDKTALVIGATGYLGGHVALALDRHGFRVTGMSRSDDGDVRLRQSGIESLRGDLSNLSSVAGQAARYDCVVYTAQLMLEQEREAIETLADKLSDDSATLIFCSGTGVLGERTDGKWSENTFAEDEPFTPSPYLGDRIQTENIVRAGGPSGRLRGIVVRPPMIWGHGGCGFTRLFYRDAARHGEVAYIAPGLNLYSHVHVDDLAEVFALAAIKGAAGGLYHAVAGEVANRTIAEKVAEDAGVPVRGIDMKEAFERWEKHEVLLGMASSSRSRSPRTRNDLDWKPAYLDLLSEIGHPAYRALLA